MSSEGASPLLHAGDRSPTACADTGPAPAVGDAPGTDLIARLSCSFRGAGPESVPSSVSSRSPIPTRAVFTRDGPRQAVTVIAGTVGDRNPVPDLRRPGPRYAFPRVCIGTSSSIGYD